MKICFYKSPGGRRYKPKYDVSWRAVQALVALHFTDLVSDPEAEILISEVIPREEYERLLRWSCRHFDCSKKEREALLNCVQVAVDDSGETFLVFGISSGI